MKIIVDSQIDWYRLIADLNLRGYTYTNIAAAVQGVNKNTVRYWRDGGAPRYEEGTRLIDLWCQVFVESQESVPRIKLKSRSSTIKELPNDKATSAGQSK